MAHINDHLVNMSSDYGNSGSSLFLRTNPYASLDSNLSVASHSNPVIIDMPDSSESKRSSNNSLDRETSPYESSFDAFLSYGGVRSDHDVGSVLAPSATIRYSYLPILASSKMDVTILNRE